MTKNSLVVDDKNLEQKNVIQCENCHAEVNGKFCSQCGQSIESTLAYFWTVILHLLDDIFSFDSRASRTLIPLIVKPGFLTLQYFAGHRVHYVPPLRLYLFISIIFFLSLKLTTSSDYQGVIKVNDNSTISAQLTEQINRLNLTADPEVTKALSRLKQYQSDLEKNNGFLLHEMTKEIAELELKMLDKTTVLTEKEQEEYQSLTQNIANFKAGQPIINADADFTIGNQPDGSLAFPFLSDDSNQKLNRIAKNFQHKVITTAQHEPKKLVTMALDKLPQLMFVLLPIFALILKIMYLFAKRLYLEHLTVALHSHSFIFLMILLIELIDFSTALVAKDNSWQDISSLLILAIVVWIPSYLYMMQRRVYQQSHLLTAIKYSLIACGYLLLLSVTALAAFVWGVTTS